MWDGNGRFRETLTFFQGVEREPMWDGNSEVILPSAEMFAG